VTTITSRLFLIIGLFGCLLTANAVRPVSGRVEEDDLKKQVESLSKKVEDQKKQIDSLSSDYEKFKAQQIQWDKDTSAGITQRDGLVAQHTQRLTQINDTITQQGVVLAQHTQRLTQIIGMLTQQGGVVGQHTQRLTQIEARLRAGRL